MDDEALPARPLDTARFLEALRDQVSLEKSKVGISKVIDGREYLDKTDEELGDVDLKKILFKYIHNRKDRAIVRRYFANLDE